MPILGSIGVALGATAGTTTATALGAGAVAATGFGIAKTISNSRNQVRSANEAAQRAQEQNALAVQNVKNAQANASTVAANTTADRNRARSSRSIYTSPLGIRTQAVTAKKILLGE